MVQVQQCNPDRGEPVRGGLPHQMSACGMEHGTVAAIILELPILPMTFALDIALANYTLLITSSQSTAVCYRLRWE